MRPATSARMMTGTLTRNTEPHQKCSSRKPEATGPMAAPPPAMPAQTAMALGRSSGGNTLVRMESVAGMTKAAASPITARAPITAVEESAVAASSVPNRNRTSPACSAPLRPNRSPRVPAVKSIPANTRE